MQEAIRRELNLPQLPEPPDVADALAIALCHCYLSRIRQSSSSRRLGARDCGLYDLPQQPILALDPRLSALDPPMITKITGTPVAVAADTLTLAVGAFEYEILIPEFARRNLQDKIGREVSLHTVEYLEGNAMQGRLIPRLVGFLNPIEREFFDMFCEVDGVGVKKALRAMVRPVQEVATMIEEQDAKGLATLPGVGPATAERIIAKLRRKVPKFALLVARDTAAGGRRRARPA